MKLSSPKDLKTLANESYSFNQGTSPSRFDKTCAPLKGSVLDRSKPKGQPLICEDEIAFALSRNKIITEQTLLEDEGKNKPEINQN